MSAIEKLSSVNSGEVLKVHVSIHRTTVRTRVADYRVLPRPALRKLLRETGGLANEPYITVALTDAMPFSAWLASELSLVRKPAQVSCAEGTTPTNSEVFWEPPELAEPAIGLWVVVGLWSDEDRATANLLWWTRARFPLTATTELLSIPANGLRLSEC